jgi:hypothetical protein
MAENRHVGKGSPTFRVEGNPDTFINLVANHGVVSRVMRARKCPCETNGSPDMYCTLCRGDGSVYDFQRKLLQTDEDSDVKGDRSFVHPFRVPIMEPVKVERMLAPEQGGIKKYNIVSYDAYSIKISGNPLPYHWNKMRVSYYFDRFNAVVGDRVNVDPNTRMLTTTKTLFDGQYQFGNALAAHGDITIVTKVYSESTGYEYTNIDNFRKNQIILAASEPEPVVDDILVDYYYASLVPVLPAPLITQETKSEKWESLMSSGQVQIGLDPFYELSQGDIITLMAVELFREETITHSSSSIDKLMEFDISRVDDDILDQDGKKYRRGTDFVLQGFRDIVWIGNQPEAGKNLSVRYSYRPTFIVFESNPEVNFLENKRYPTVVNTRLWGKTLQKDIERIENPMYTNF